MCTLYVYNIRRTESISEHAKKITGKTIEQMNRFRICSQFHKIITQRGPEYLWDKLRFGRSKNMRTDSATVSVF
jgi:hypothetical protein